MTDSLNEELQLETLKWLDRAEEQLLRISPDEGSIRKNISAYLSDSRYFLEKGDLIRAFEAVIWAWAWMEIGQEVGILEEIHPFRS
jgi:hypothetical protein